MFQLLGHVAHMGLKRRARSNFQEDPLAHSDCPFDALLEEDRVSNVTPPIGGVRGGARKDAVGNGRKIRDGPADGVSPAKLSSSGLFTGHISSV